MHLEKVKKTNLNSFPTYLQTSVMTKRRLTMHSRATESTTMWLIVVWRVSVDIGLSEMCCQWTKTKVSLQAIWSVSHKHHFKKQHNIRLTNAAHCWHINSFLCLSGWCATSSTVFGSCEWFLNWHGSLKMAAFLEKSPEFTKAMHQNLRVQIGCKVAEFTF